MTPEDVSDLTVPSHLVSPWLGFVVPRDAGAKPAAQRPGSQLPKAA